MDAELHNRSNDQENFLDRKKLEADKLHMSKIVLLSRVGNNKTKIWKPNKIDAK